MNLIYSECNEKFLCAQKGKMQVQVNKPIDGYKYVLERKQEAIHHSLSKYVNI